MWCASFKKSEATPDARPSSSRRLAPGTDSSAAVLTTFPYLGDLGSASMIVRKSGSKWLSSVFLSEAQTAR